MCAVTVGFHMFFNYRYTFPEKCLFMTLWLMGGLFVAINAFSNPIASLSSLSQMVSIGVSIFQAAVLLMVWVRFSNQRCSIGDALRTLGLGVVALPYTVAVGQLFYTSLSAG